MSFTMEHLEEALNNAETVGENIDAYYMSETSLSAQHQCLLEKKYFEVLVEAAREYFKTWK